jgi:hypothetical protein
VRLTFDSRLPGANRAVVYRLLVIDGLNRSSMRSAPIYLQHTIWCCSWTVTRQWLAEVAARTARRIHLGPPNDDFRCSSSLDRF